MPRGREAGRLMPRHRRSDLRMQAGLKGLEAERCSAQLHFRLRSAPPRSARPIPPKQEGAKAHWSSTAPPPLAERGPGPGRPSITCHRSPPASATPPLHLRSRRRPRRSELLVQQPICGQQRLLRILHNPRCGHGTPRWRGSRRRDHLVHSQAVGPCPS